MECCPDIALVGRPSYIQGVADVVGAVGINFNIKPIIGSINDSFEGHLDTTNFDINIKANFGELVMDHSTNNNQSVFNPLD